jgi:hypothetical protein
MFPSWFIPTWAAWTNEPMAGADIIDAEIGLFRESEGLRFLPGLFALALAGKR